MKTSEEFAEAVRKASATIRDEQASTLGVQSDFLTIVDEALSTLARAKIDLEQARKPEVQASSASIFGFSQAFRAQENKVSEMIGKELERRIKEIRGSQ